LDASKLDARWAFIEGPINGKSRVKLNAPKGTVTVPSVDGEANVEITGNRITILNINGKPKVTVRGKYVTFGAINGKDTVVEVILTPGGSLRFRELLGGSKLFWKKENPSDPKAMVFPGRVAPESEFVEKN